MDGVDPKSTTETYVAVRLAADTWRWAGRADPDPGGQVHAGHRHRGGHPLQAAPARRVRYRAVRRPNSLRFRVWPETAVGLDLAGKKPGGGLEPLLEELTFAGQPGSDMRPYDRLIGAALDGDRWLFARQDTVEAAWQVVDPVLGDVGPVHPTPGAAGARRKPTGCCPSRDTWHDPAG